MTETTKSVEAPPRCATCGDCGYVRTEKQQPFYFHCGCKFHTWCPDCTNFIGRAIDRLLLRFWPVG